jgi:membrane protein YqaA with SNARE-associated domain
MEIDKDNLEERGGSWIEKYSHSKYADRWLSIVSFAESSFFLIPPDTLMIAIMSTRERHSRWIYYGTLTTVMSVLGGLFGYLLGSFFYETIGKTIIGAYDLKDYIEQVGVMFKNNSFLAIFIAGFTPIPYKVFTLASGFFDINIWTFIIASILGRGGRFFAVAFTVSILGDKFGSRPLKYLNYFAGLVALVVVLFFLYKLVPLFIG